MGFLEDERFTRTDFLKAGGALIVTLGAPPVVQKASGRPRRLAVTAWPDVDPSKLDSWLAVNADGTVTAFSGKVELGQGNQTALSQIIAEELDVPLGSVHLVMGDTARCPDQGATVDSQTIAMGGSQLRQAAADGRQALLGLAAMRLGVPVSELTVKDGVVLVRSNPAEHVSYGELVGGRLLGVTIPVTRPPGPPPPLGSPFPIDGPFTLGGTAPKDPSEYSLVGMSVPRADIPAKVTGEFMFIQDVRVPGMLHGRVIRPKGLGSRLLGHAKPPTGVQVVRLNDFLGVVAEREWDAIKAAQNLKVQWSSWAGLPAMSDLYAYIERTPSKDRLVTNNGDVETTLAGAPRTLEASYTTPLQTHGSIGPSCAIADVKNGSATIWSGTQAPNLVRVAVSQVLGLPIENVRVITYEASGCYGRNGADPATIDAALMSQAVGRPVRIQWMRGDEHGWDPKGPATVHRLRGGLDAQGNVVAWDHQAWIPASFDLTLIGSVLAGRTTREPSFHLWDGPLLYNFPVYRQLAHDQEDIASAENNGVGVISSWVRSPVQFQVQFAMESFMDELAAAAAVDPIAFRLRYLKDARMIALLQRVTQVAAWQPRPSPGPDARSSKTVVRGRGVATSLRVGTYDAEVAEVEVNRDTGQITVTQMIVGQDNGLTINPQAVKLGIEGGVVQTVSRTLIEEVTFDHANITSLEWNGYPIIRFMEAPHVEVVLVDQPALPATGSGEPCVNPVAPAIANAVYDATGVRIRALPLRPNRVHAALLQAGSGG